MKITLKELVPSAVSLHQLCSVPIKDAKLKYSLARTKKRVDVHVETFWETHNAILRELGERNKDNPDRYQIKPENIEEFEKQVKALNSTEIDDDFWLIEYKSIENIEVPPAALAGIWWLIKGEPSKDAPS